MGAEPWSTLLAGHRLPGVPTPPKRVNWGNWGTERGNNSPMLSRYWGYKESQGHFSFHKPPEQLPCSCCSLHRPHAAPLFPLLRAFPAAHRGFGRSQREARISRGSRFALRQRRSRRARDKSPAKALRVHGHSWHLASPAACKLSHPDTTPTNPTVSSGCSFFFSHELHHLAHPQARGPWPVPVEAANRAVLPSPCVKSRDFAFSWLAGCHPVTKATPEPSQPQNLSPAGHSHTHGTQHTTAPIPQQLSPTPHHACPPRSPGDTFL